MAGWILVADRDSEDRMRLFHLLEREGHRATVVDEGREALTLLRAEPFDLALIDLGLPSRGAHELVGMVKRDPGLSHIPLIVTTECRDKDAISACLDTGAEDYLLKPVNPVSLRARITAGLAKKRLHDLEAEHEGQVRHLAEAAASIGSEAFVSADLEHLARGTDACSHVARVLLRAAAQIEGREQGLRDEVASLWRQLGEAGRRDGSHERPPTRVVIAATAHPLDPHTGGHERNVERRQGMDR